MAALPFLDTNVLIRHITNDHSVHSPQARAFLLRVERGEVEVRTADTVIFETVYTLEKLYGLSRPDIRDAVLPIIELPSVRLPAKASFRDVFDLYVSQRSLSFAGGYHTILVRRLRLPAIPTFDRAFDKVPGIVRQEPVQPDAVLDRCAGGTRWPARPPSPLAPSSARPRGR